MQLGSTLVYRLLLTSGLTLGFSAGSQAGEAPPVDAPGSGSTESSGNTDAAHAEASAEASAQTSEAGRPDRVADGGRVSVRDGDFSLLAPKGWEVYEHLPSLTLLLQVPHEEGSKYQRTIQVASFTGPRYIDEVTSREYEDVITRKFSSTSAAIEGYRIRNHLTIELTDGRPGLLFYSEFSLDGVNLMQAHVLISSQKRHYLISYTDLAEHFENEAANQYLSEAWDAMISAQLSSATPLRFATVAYAAFAGGVLTLLIVLAVGLRKWRAGQSFRDYADGDSEDGGDSSDSDTEEDGKATGVRRGKSGRAPKGRSARGRRAGDESREISQLTKKRPKPSSHGQAGRQASGGRNASDAAVSLGVSATQPLSSVSSMSGMSSMPSSPASAMSSLHTLDQGTLHPGTSEVSRLPKNAKSTPRPQAKVASNVAAEPSEVDDPLSDSDDFAM